jgi:hypothetical protein
MGLHADRVDAFFRPFAMGKVVSALDDAFLRKIDRSGPAGLRHRRDAVAIGGKRAPRFDLAGTGLSDFRVVAMLCLITGNRELVVNSRQF